MEQTQNAGYAQITPETTEADFLSGRTGFALGFDRVWLICGAEASSWPPR